MLNVKYAVFTHIPVNGNMEIHVPLQYHYAHVSLLMCSAEEVFHIFTQKIL
jgi:hypothetical protein